MKLSCAYRTSRFTGLLLVTVLILTISSAVRAFEVNVATDYGFDPVDSTNYFQAALDSGASRVIVPDMGQDWIVGRMQLRSNQEVVFEDGVVVAAKPGSTFNDPHSRLFTGLEVSNVTLNGYGATLRMNKSEYATGEQRHALALFGATNVTVKGLTILDSGGDGIIVTNGLNSGSRSYTETVLIEDVVLDNHRRQGISVISARNLTIRNVVTSNTNGTPPSAGIDLEPNDPDNRLDNIVIDGLTVEGNAGTGVLMYLKQLDSTSHPVSIDISNVTINNSARYGFAVAGSGDGLLQGRIDIHDSSVSDTGGAGLLVYDKSYSEFGIYLDNVTMRNTNLGLPDNPFPDPAPIGVWVRSTYPHMKAGGISILNSDVYDIADRSYIAYQDDTGQSLLSKVNGSFDLYNPYGLTGHGLNINLAATLQWTPFLDHRFESAEGFTQGTVIAQQGWFRPLAFNNGGTAEVVEGGVNGMPAASEGSHLLRITDATGNTRFARALGPNPFDQPTYVAIDLAYDTLGSGLTSAILSLTNADGNFNGAMFGFRKHNGQVYFTYRDGENYVDLDPGFNPQLNTFYRFIAMIDPTTGEYDLELQDLNGQTLASVQDADVRGSVSQFQYLTLNILGNGGTSTLYADRIIVAPITLLPAVVPEPSTAVIISTACGMLLAWRRRESMRARSRKFLSRGRGYEKWPT